MNSRTRGDAAWGSWMAASAVTFGLMEIAAVRRGNMPTLSRTLERWLGTQTRLRHGGPLLFALFWTVLAVHIATMPPVIVVVEAALPEPSE